MTVDDAYHYFSDIAEMIPELIAFPVQRPKHIRSVSNPVRRDDLPYPCAVSTVRVLTVCQSLAVRMTAVVGPNGHGTPAELESLYYLQDFATVRKKHYLTCWKMQEQPFAILPKTLMEPPNDDSEHINRPLLMLSKLVNPHCTAAKPFDPALSILTSATDHCDCFHSMEACSCQNKQTMCNCGK